MAKSFSPVIAQFEEACALFEARRVPEAEALFRKLLARAPDFAPALGNLAELLRTRGDVDEAITLFKRALKLEPKRALIRSNYGAALLNLGQVDAAIAEFNKALKDDPGQYRARSNLGVAYLQLGRPQEAKEQLEQVVAAVPHSYPANSSLGAAYLRLGRAGDAINALAKAIAIEPHVPDARCTLAGAFSVEGRVAESLQQYREALQLRPAMFEAWASMLFTMHQGEGADPETLYEEHLRFGIAYAQKTPEEPIAAVVDRSPDKRLRIGYVSPDMRHHSVGLFLAPVLEAHDHERFEIFAYSLTHVKDAHQARIAAAVHHFVDASTMSDVQLKEKIQSDGIDILIDLTGHTTGNRIGVFARRAAPVQITWLGYPDTTGLPTMDYRITDAVADPPGVADALHTEELLRLPNCFVAFARRPEITPKTEPPSVARGSITFGSFNNLTKLSQRIAKLWASILNQVDGSRLLLKSRSFEREANRFRVLSWFANEGVKRDRIEFFPFVEKWEDSLKHYENVDIALDTFPYNGTTTTCDTLSMGVPLVTLRGSIHASRVSASILHSIGQDALIAATEEEYAKIAVDLAKDPARLAKLRATLAEGWPSSPVGNVARLAADLEGAYRQAWKNYCDNVPRRAVPDAKPIRLGADEFDFVAIPNVEVAVPRSLENITSYVLREQKDWFEDELPFVRKLFEPGMRAIDCGASYGIFALTMAKLAGETGRVWALEPAPRTAAHVRQSIGKNGLSNLSLFEAALSDKTGHAWLQMGSDSELNALNANPALHTGAIASKVQMYALDDFAREADATKIDFFKIDAEGEEERIVRGGERFFANESPLVMAELRHGGLINTGLLEAFSSVGYSAYRLVPELLVLSPVTVDYAFDSFVLNVFFCKQDRQEALAKKQLLARGEHAPSPVKGAWRKLLERYDYGRTLIPIWDDGVSRAPGRELLEEGLDLWAIASDESQDACLRVRALDDAFARIARSVEQQPTLSRRLTLARLASANGQRGLAVKALDGLVASLQAGEALDLNEPLLAPCPRYETVALGDSPAAWCYASVLEQRERLRALSSFYTGRSAGPTLDALEEYGFLEGEMERRRKLIAARYTVAV